MYMDECQSPKNQVVFLLTFMGTGNVQALSVPEHSEDRDSEDYHRFRICECTDETDGSERRIDYRVIKKL